MLTAVQSGALVAREDGERGVGAASPRARPCLPALHVKGPFASSLGTLSSDTQHRLPQWRNLTQEDLQLLELVLQTAYGSMWLQKLMARRRRGPRQAT